MSSSPQPVPGTPDFLVLLALPDPPRHCGSTLLGSLRILPAHMPQELLLLAPLRQVLPVPGAPLGGPPRGRVLRLPRASRKWLGSGEARAGESGVAALPADRGGPDTEETERCSTKPHNKAFAHILELAGEGPFCPGRRPLPGTGRAVEEAPAAALLTEADGDAGQVETEAGEEAESRVAWEQAAAAFQALLHFTERQPCFSSQEVGQLQALHSAFRRQLQLRAAVKLEALQDGPGGCRATAHPDLPCSSTAGDN
ncbi:Jerky protein [Sciurus carolinensis]|uniref:Jerky protein n=1 Tax=Sciurus carolinensis TaxID=30640 RepID=A0AA41N020_SCICA|nr:Jerky protein [Sciurus carolinensis]